MRLAPPIPPIGGRCKKSKVFLRLVGSLEKTKFALLKNYHVHLTDAKASAA